MGSIKKRRAEEPPLPSRRTIAVLAHGITKEGRVPDEEIDRARARMQEFAADPRHHTYAEG
jgi:hypothetical protein